MREASEGFNHEAWDYDGRDWWFRTSFEAEEGPFLLHCGGLATIADVWINGTLILHSDNMFHDHYVEVRLAAGRNDLVLRCEALKPHLERRRSRPRWRTAVGHRNMRWVRTSQIGRVPGWTLTSPPVGPWRPIELFDTSGPTVLSKQVLATCDPEGAGGAVQVQLRVAGPIDEPCWIEIAGRRAPLHQTPSEPSLPTIQLSGSVRLDYVERWWPATLGDQPLYPVTAILGSTSVNLSPVGFRTVAVDRSDGGFEISINGVSLFCRGAVWWPADSIAVSSSQEDMRASLALAKAAHMNMIRVCGLGMYEIEKFWDLCDELGLLVWQDCMIAFGDPPEDEDFNASVVKELRDNLGWLGGHPSLTVVAGSLQVHEQAAMAGGLMTQPESTLLDEIIPAFVEAVSPGLPYVPSTPTGGIPPFHVDVGIGQYYGVGMYLRDPSDARDSGVRFASECLFMATPPDPTTVDDLCGGAGRAGHHPEWKKAVHADPGRGWDKEDLREYYVQRLLGIDAVMLRHTNPERALDVGRASNAQLVTQLFTQWRRAGSACRGAMVLGLRDQRPGAGWGLVDSMGLPKSTWYAFRQVAAPVTVLITDEALKGLAIHVVNDRRAVFAGRVRLQLFADGVTEVAVGEIDVTVAPTVSVATEDIAILGEFRDANFAYQFSAPSHDVVVATLFDEGGDEIAAAFHFPLGLNRPIEPDLGLRARACPAPGGKWDLEVSTRRLAQWVLPRVEGYRAEDAWFHLPPGGVRRVSLQPTGSATGQPEGVVGAWNCRTRVPIERHG